MINMDKMLKTENCLFIQKKTPFMKYYTYVLKSFKNQDIYIGSTDNITKRVKLHNQGKVKSTKAYRPWILLEYREFNSRSEAVNCERFLKTGQQKEILKKRYNLI